MLTTIALVPATTVRAEPPSSLRVATVTGSVAGVLERRLPFASRNVAVYWKGHSDAKVTIAFSRDGTHFRPAIDVGRDEIGMARDNGMTYGALLTTFNAVAVRVHADEVIQRLTVLGVRDRVRNLVTSLAPATAPPAGTERPPIIARSEWGANESLRYRSDGTEKWTPQFAPITKLIVHHTDTANNDRNPAATVRAIYQYHAITQDWGDIGYNFLIDEAGRIYKGRASHPPGGGESINGQDSQGRGVIGAHALNHNKGSVGVALLGTLTSQDASPAAKRALEWLLAWEADRARIDPNGASPYTSSTGAQETFPNIGGHRDTGRQTACPGDTFYATLPEVRANVAARMGHAT